MIAEGQQLGRPFSKEHENLLRARLTEVPQITDVGEYEFTKKEITDDVSAIETRFNLDSQDWDWQRHFKESSGIPVAYRLDIDTIVSDWVATLVDSTEFDNPTKSSISGYGDYKVTVDTISRGKITFILFFDAEELLKSSPQSQDTDFLIAFQTPDSGIDREPVYEWHSVCDADFSENITRYLIENQVPSTIELFNSSSYIGKNVPEGPKRALVAVAKNKGYKIRNQPHLTENIQLAGSEVDIASLDMAIEIDEDTHLTVCNCEESAAENTHVHLIESGDTVPPKGNEEAKEMLDIVLEKANDYNDLTDDYENVSRVDRLLQAAVVVGIVPALGVIYRWFIGDTVDGGFFILNTIVLTILLGLAFVIWSPLIELRLFSWNIPKSCSGIRGKAKAKFWN